MIQRKILKKIEYFYKNSKNKVLMITGARQVGKSFIIEEYCKTYKSYIKIDFINDKRFLGLFKNCNNADDILLKLSSIFNDKLIKNETIIFFDEVQECPEIITYIKYLIQEGSYKYILSGSLLGTILKDIASIPVGYISIIRMYPLDFEEFIAANGVSNKVIDKIKENYDNKSPVDDFIHNRMLELFRMYLVIGGMPKVVQTFLDSKNIYKVSLEQKSIMDTYKYDIAKYDKDNKLYLKEIYDLIPSELNSKNKRFILKNLNENSKFNKYLNSFIWLKNAGVALPCFSTSETKSPLLINKFTNLFKLFLSDVGLLVNYYGNDTQINILNNKDNINFGSIYENIIAQELQSHNYDLFFYNNKKRGEIDFLIEDNNKVIAIEVKSGKDYKRHVALTNAIEDKLINHGIVLSNQNLSKDNNIEYLPIYMIMFIKKEDNNKDYIYSSNFKDLNEYVK